MKTAAVLAAAFFLAAVIAGVLGLIERSRYQRGYIHRAPHGSCKRGGTEAIT